MEISEIDSIGTTQNSTFCFETVQIEYKKEELKNINDYFMKWGLDKTIIQTSFRFNLKYSEIVSENFIQDFFNDKNVKNALSFLNFPKENALNIKFKKLRCSLTNLNIFDILEEKEIVVQDYIKKTFDDRYEDIDIQDLLRECILKEESENYTLFDANTREELLFKIFSHFVIGGSMCQYEDKLSPYLDLTKLFYKNMINVRKDQNSNNLFVESLVYSIQSIKNGFEITQHPQDFLYLIISPSLKIVNVFYNRWEKYW